MSGQKSTSIKRYYELCDVLHKYNYAYYNQNKPLVDDAKYDALIKELIELEEQHPEIKRSDSPSLHVGGEVSSTFKQVPHDPPMLSLANCSTETEFIDFCNRCSKLLPDVDPGSIEYSAELKYDGLALEIIYENGILVRGATRGNGVSGEDITVNVLTIKKISHYLDPEKAPRYLSLRGEVFMAHKEFDRLNAQREADGEQLFANPRNAASGSLRQLDANITAERQLDVVFYNIGKVSDETDLDTHEQFIQFIKDLGFPTAHYSVKGTLEDIKTFYFHWVEHRHELPFDIDGIVIKLNDFAHRELAGLTSKTPKWAIAWKFPAQEAITQLVSVDCQVGRTGIITPVANLVPINIGGVIVKRATLHNFSEVERLGIEIGDTVTVIRAGDVIPKVIGVNEKPESGQAIEEPRQCPGCGSELHREDIYLRCVNEECPAVNYEYLKFFVSKDGMDIEFFGPELVTRLNKAGKLAKMSDIFNVTREDLLQLERMGEKLADKIIDSINKRRRISLSFFLKSLGIRNVGDHVARVMARSVVSLDELLKKSTEDLEAIHEVGPEVARSVVSYLKKDATLTLLQELQHAGVEIMDEEVPQSGDSDVRGKTFVLTGTLEKLTRKQAQDMIDVLGGKASGSVSKKTDYVVAGENAGSKLSKAQELGITILSEDEFIKMTGE